MKQTHTWALALLALLGIFGFIFFRPTPAVAPTTDANNFDVGSTTTTIQLPADPLRPLVAEGYTIERVADAPAPKVAYPTLNRPISPQASAEVVRSVSEAVETLVKKPMQLDVWMHLAALRFSMKDYEGARDIWNFAAAYDVPGVYENLGNLYASYLPNAQKAELNYQKAIAQDPADPRYYRALAEFYIQQKKNVQAEATLRAGIKAAPLATDLSVLLARSLREWGNILESNATYDAAIAAAEKAGNIALAESIRAEKEQR